MNPLTPIAPKEGQQTAQLTAVQNAASAWIAANWHDGKQLCSMDSNTGGFWAFCAGHELRDPEVADLRRAYNECWAGSPKVKEELARLLARCAELEQALTGAKAMLDKLGAFEGMQQVGKTTHYSRIVAALKNSNDKR